MIQVVLHTVIGVVIIAYPNLSAVHGRIKSVLPGTLVPQGFENMDSKSVAIQAELYLYKLYEDIVMKLLIFSLFI